MTTDDFRKALGREMLKALGPLQAAEIIQEMCILAIQFSRQAELPQDILQQAINDTITSVYKGGTPV